MWVIPSIINIGIYRIFSTYGPGLKRQIIFDVIKKIINNKTSIEIIGSGQERRDITFVEVKNYEGQGSGPGLSLLKCKDYLQTPFIFTS